MTVNESLFFITNITNPRKQINTKKKKGISRSVQFVVVFARAQSHLCSNLLQMLVIEIENETLSSPAGKRAKDK